jgi:ATP-dependent protease ClpP protease subunit
MREPKPSVQKSAPRYIEQSDPLGLSSTPDAHQGAVMFQGKRVGTCLLLVGWPILATVLEVNGALSDRTPTANAQGAIGQRQAAGTGSASVTGDVPCEGSAVGFSIDINGDIDASTVESVSRLFAAYHDKEAKVNGGLKCAPAIDRTQFNPAAYGVHYGINSRGGSVAAAMAIGRMFRREHAWLGVDGVCISACVLILAGAVDRQIGKTAAVGIHRPFLVSSPQNPLKTEQVKQAYEYMLQDMRAYLREMNVSDRLADDMLAVEPQSVRFLTQAELKEYGLGRVDPAEQQRRAIENEARDVGEANQLGLDRMEYTRRKALAESICERTPAGEAVTDYTEFWNCKRRVLKTGQR